MSCPNRADALGQMSAWKARWHLAQNSAQRGAASRWPRATCTLLNRSSIVIRKPLDTPSDDCHLQGAGACHYGSLRQSGDRGPFPRLVYRNSRHIRGARRAYWTGGGMPCALLAKAESQSHTVHA
jgi:hypothetical protein